MNPPPFLLFATLAFWGWQSGLLWVGVALGIVLESSRFIKARFDLADEDFRRIWNLCTVLTLALAAIVFTTNDEGGGVISNPTVNNASNASVHTATTLLRWLPMTLFLFIAAQRFSERGVIPLSAISLTFRRRRRKNSEPVSEREVDVSYPYFIVCLFAAGFHANQGTHTYFLGLAVLFAWALWPARSRRFGIFAWLAALTLAVALIRLSLILVIVAGVVWFVATYLWRKRVPHEVPPADADLPWRAWDQASGAPAATDSAAAKPASDL